MLTLENQSKPRIMLSKKKHLEMKNSMPAFFFGWLHIITKELDQFCLKQGSVQHLQHFRDANGLGGKHQRLMSQ